MSLHDTQATLDPGDSEPKHTVFLCHTGAQKGFVAQLNLDLRNVDRYPFFDRDRESLPIGEPFPDRIFKAIEHCQVGVVILSEQFFMSSPWPMIEVSKMVECGRKIMPVFLGISPEDLSNAVQLAKWRLEWQVWEKSNKRIKIPVWERAVKHLRTLNGLKYNYAGGAGDVVEFRKEIVQEICKEVPASHRWDDSHVQGKSRLSKVIEEKIANIAMSHGVGMVGLYGVGGIGKTTACKSLCKELCVEFCGRVCHLEFGNDTTEKDRVQEALKRLTGASKEFVIDKNLDEGWSRLKELLQVKKVFLAIDNVSSDFKVCEEARKYLEVGYCQGSVVMVTARALGELEYVSVFDSNCLPMPELVKDEAKALFLHYAKPKNEVDEKVLRRCINRCFFRKGKGNGCHYHPLALKVLGSQLVDRNPGEWGLQLEDEDVFNQRRERHNPVFSILRRSFDDLRDDDKLLFMDVALFDTGDSKYKKWRDGGFIDSNEYTRTWYIFEWLSIVHGSSVDVLKNRLSALRKRALLEELGDGTAQIGMHDLWREFAVMETKRGDKESWRWVYELVGNEAKDSCLSGGGWKTLRRICFMKKERVIEEEEDHEEVDEEEEEEICEQVEEEEEECEVDSHYCPGVKCVNFTSCSKVTVLKLVDVEIENQTIDLSPLKQLKSLVIVSYGIYEGRVLKVSGIGQLSNLAVLLWLNICVESFSAVEEISCLTNLQVLQLRACWDAEISTMLDLQQLRWLREVRVNFEAINFRFGSQNTSLRILDLEACTMLESCRGLDDVVALEVLVLNGCKRLEELPYLGKLTKLRKLHIQECESLKALPGVGSLVALQEFHASSCKNLGELPDMSRLTNLEVLDFGGCELLRCIPGLGNLVALRTFDVDASSLNDWPDLGNLTKLQKVKISEHHELSTLEVRPVLNLGTFEYVTTLKLWNVHKHEISNLSKLTPLKSLTLLSVRIRELTNLSALTALKSLHLRDCSLEKLPHMGKDMRLESLLIEYCKSLRGWDGVGRVESSESQTEVDLHCNWTLPSLTELKWKAYWWEVGGVLELPDLGCFPRLKTLELGRLSYFMKVSAAFLWRRIWCRPKNLGTSFSMWPQEFAVRCRAEHLHLERVEFRELPITELPDLRNFPSLIRLKITRCHKLASLTASGPLPALESLHLKGCSGLNAFPDVDLLPKLSFLIIEMCGVELNAQQAEKLRARGFRQDEYGFWEVNQELSTNKIVLPDCLPNCNSGVQLALDGPNDLDAGPSSLEVELCSSEFIPYNESISELGLIPVPKRALELQSSSEIDLSLLSIPLWFLLSSTWAFSVWSTYRQEHS